MILCKDATGKEQIRIIDFGIAKILANEKQQLTKTGEIFGSPLYMSPEQCRAKSLDARSDVYLLSCAFYEMLTGVPPFCGINVVDTIFMHLNQKPPSFKKANANVRISNKIEKIVMRGLEKNPTDRYQSMQALSLDLERVKAGGNPSFYVSFKKGIALLGVALLLFVVSIIISATVFVLAAPGWMKLWRTADRAVAEAKYSSAANYYAEDQATELRARELLS